MPLKTIQKKKVYLEAMNQIRSAIVAGEYKIDDKLPSEKELTGIFSISRASVREALCGLNALGLIKSKMGEGYYVRSNKSFTAMELLLGEEGNPLEILEARKMIEPEIVQVAARRREKADLEDLNRMVALASDILAGKVTSSLDNFINADMELHRVFARATHNDVLISIEERLIGYMKQRGWDELKRRVDTRPEIVKRYWNQHKAICNAICRNLPMKASEQMRKHLQGITRDLLRQVKCDVATRPQSEGFSGEGRKSGNNRITKGGKR